jgi:hypothetical protein
VEAQESDEVSLRRLMSDFSAGGSVFGVFDGGVPSDRGVRRVTRLRQSERDNEHQTGEAGAGVRRSGSRSGRSARSER